ncbi:MAG: YwiC-like family protein [Calditrichaeota bacterium]|nr:YwiC-like family protein [Calditrichota bacterium]
MPKRSQKSRIPLPREHGAWGILIGAFLSVPAYTKTIAISQITFLLAILLLFISREPLLQMIRGKYQRDLFLWFLRFAVAGAGFLALSAYLAGFPELIAYTALMSLFFVFEMVLVRQGKAMSFLAHLIGTIGLTTIAPLTLLIHTRSVQPTVWFIWFLNILFFVSGILFVRYEIALKSRSARNRQEARRYRMAMILYHLLLLVFFAVLIYADNLVTSTIFLFLPITLQGFWAVISQQAISNLKLVGWLQVGQTLFFVFLIAWLI